MTLQQRADDVVRMWRNAREHFRTLGLMEGAGYLPAVEIEFFCRLNAKMLADETFVTGLDAALAPLQALAEKQNELTRTVGWTAADVIRQIRATLNSNDS